MCRSARCWQCLLDQLVVFGVSRGSTSRLVKGFLSVARGAGQRPNRRPPKLGLPDLLLTHLSAILRRMNRNEKLLSDIDLATAVGIEVGALDKPVVPPTTAGIFYVDHADTPALRIKYATEPSVTLENLVQVSGVWGEKTLAEAASAIAPVDFLIASHVIEHVPDLITWLQEIASVVKPTGQVRLALPDRRYTFDLLRSESVFADVLSAHLIRARVPQPRAVIDHVLNVAVVNCHHAWDGALDVPTLKKYHAPEEAEQLARDIIKNGSYHDVHCWVFTPYSFAGLMVTMVEQGLHSFGCAQFYDTEYHTLEFIVSLQPLEDRAAAIASWKDVQARAADHGLDQQMAQVRESQQAARAEAEAEIHRLNEMVSTLKGTIEDLRRSRSWRITAPLRAIRESIKHSAR